MLPKQSDVVFSTDMYSSGSIKDKERQHRGTAEKLLISTSTKRPSDWGQFLMNSDNKEQLVRVVHQVWSQDTGVAHKLAGRNVVLISQGKAYLFTSTDGHMTEQTEISSLHSTQEETDTRVILYCLYAKEKGYENIRVRSPDSDIFFILLHYISLLQGMKVLSDTGTGNKRRLLNISDIALQYSEEHRTALMALHAYTGCDTTSAFKGKGKVNPIKIMQQKPRFISALASLGDRWDVSTDTYEALEALTCSIYGSSKFTDIDQCRFFKLKDKCDETLDSTKSVDMGSLPPCRSCLKQHINRVNYQVGIWKRSHIAEPTLPAPSEDHGWTSIEGHREPLWTQEDIIPPELVSILQQELNAEDESDDDLDSAIIGTLHEDSSDDDD